MPLIRNTDATVVNTGASPLQKALMLKELNEPDYRQQELDLQKERLEQSAQIARQKELAKQRQQSLEVYTKMSDKLDEASKGLPGGMYNNQIEAGIKNVLDEMTKEQKETGSIRRTRYIPIINQLIGWEQKAKLIMEGKTGIVEDYTKSYPISDLAGLKGLVSKKLLFNGEDSKGNPILKSIGDVNIEKAIEDIGNDPRLLDFINRKKVAQNFVGSLAEMSKSTPRVGSGSLHDKIVTTHNIFTKYSHIDPETGMPSFSSVPDNEETRMEFTMGIGKEPLLNDTLYELALNDPQMRKIGNLMVRKYNQGLPPNKQIGMDSPQAAIIRKRGYLNMLAPALGGTTSTTIKNNPGGGSDPEGNNAANNTSTDPGQIIPYVFNAVSKGEIDKLVPLGFNVNEKEEKLKQAFANLGFLPKSMGKIVDISSMF